MSPIKFALFGAVAASSSALSGAAHAQAFYLQEQSARAAGRAFSGEVADTGAASLWWNPAAIAGSTDAEVAASAAVILPHGQIADRGTLIRRPGQPFARVTGDAVSRNPINNGVLPAGSIAVPIGDRVAIGLAVTSPFSFTTDYSSTSRARYTADRTKLITFDIQPSIAVAPTDWLRMGGGVNVEHSYASLSNALPNVAATLPDGEQLLEGAGWDVGWTAGVQLHNDVVTVGISYKSAIRHTLKGDLTVSGLVGPLAASNTGMSDVQARFYTPGQVIVGARVRPLDRLTLDAQYIRYSWDKFDAIRLGAPLNVAIPEDYRTSWSLAGGVDYALMPRLTVRAGVQRAITPTQNGLRDARVPDANRWNYGTGASYRLGRRFTVDAAANYVDFSDAGIDRVTAAFPGTAAQTPIVTNGVLQNARAVVLSIGGRMSF